jgi:hypothetical protein
MPRRITKAFFATAAAGATITTLGLAASPAGAAAHNAFTPTGTLVGTDANCTVTPLPSDNCGMAGYQASGRDFRYAQALITVPNHAGSVTSPADPALYVALDNSSTNTYEYARVGVAPCPIGTTADIVPDQTTATTCPTSGSGWVAFAAVDQPTTAPSIDVTSLSTATEGDGVFVSVYLEPTGNGIHTVTTLPDGTTVNHAFTVSGPAYSKDLALADWTTAIENGAAAPEPAVPDAKHRDTQFLQGRFTTLNGTRGTFNGPWTVSALEATSNGTLPPSGTLIGQPSYLWNDGSGFNGQGDDAFGVWRFPF